MAGGVRKKKKKEKGGGGGGGGGREWREERGAIECRLTTQKTVPRLRAGVATDEGPRISPRMSRAKSELSSSQSSSPSAEMLDLQSAQRFRRARTHWGGAPSTRDPVSATDETSSAGCSVDDGPSLKKLESTDDRETETATAKLHCELSTFQQSRASNASEAVVQPERSRL